MKKRTFRVGKRIFGEGTPKICVPIVATNKDAVWKKAEEIAELPVDIAEWRADFYEDIFRPEEMILTLKGLKSRLRDKALLFTFRTKGEGGQQAVEEETYYGLNRLAAQNGADLTDIEVYFRKERTKEEIERLQSAGSRVIASSHDFHGTPSAEEMVRRLLHMEEMGEDAAKLAVMPLERQDVLHLLQASIEADRLLSVPVITMSMGKMGVISRVCGSLTGSAMTFASMGEASAPGQIPAEWMTEILKILNG